MKSCPSCKSNFPAKTPRCPLDGSALVDLGPDLLAGRVVAGRYRFIERCGAGTVAEVYRAYDVRTGAHVAARVQSPTLVGDAWSRARIDDQVRSYYKAAPHEALVPVLDVVDGGNAARTLVVTEFVSTPPLSHVLLGAPLPLPTVLDAGIQLAALLEHLHRRAVLARDLRAGAVFFPGTQGHTLRVTVEALAMGPSCPPDPVPALQGASVHVAVGYVSPERAKGEPGTAAGDIYSLGALLFEMSTGRPLFQGSVLEVAKAHVHAPPPVLRAVAPGMPEALEALFMRMVAKVPRFRPTALEVRNALTALRATLP